MDDELAGHEAFARSRERFWVLVELLESNRAMRLTMSELETLVEPGFQALMAELRKEYRDLQAKRASESPGSAPEAGDGR